jgi:hypothetical protein
MSKKISLFVGDSPKWLLWAFSVFGKRIFSGYTQSLDSTSWIDCIGCGEYIDNSISEAFITICPNCGYGYTAEYRIFAIPRADRLTRNIPKLKWENEDD